MELNKRKKNGKLEVQDKFFPTMATLATLGTMLFPDTLNIGNSFNSLHTYFVNQNAFSTNQLMITQEL